MKHRWDGPRQWLEEKMKTWDGERCRKEFRNLMYRLDADALQDEYQSGMDADDYFIEHLEHEDVKVGMKVLVLNGAGNDAAVGFEGIVVKYQPERKVGKTSTFLTVHVKFDDDSDEWFAPHELGKA